MKHLFLSLSLLSFATTNTFAHGREISCQDVTTGEEILRFSAFEGKGFFANEDFSLDASSIGDDVKSMTLTEKSSGITVIANREIELLKATIQTATGEAASNVAGSHKGLAALELNLNNSSNKAIINSYERKGESFMKIELSTEKNSDFRINCRKI